MTSPTTSEPTPDRLAVEGPAPATDSGPDQDVPTRKDRRALRRTGWLPGPSTLTLVAFGVLVIPFAIILVRFLASRGHVYLPDDLAVIDLNARRALHWHQELGPFDRFGWSHPGPTYFYLLSIPYRLIGSGAQAQFIGATGINALASLGVVWAVRRRVGPATAVWAAVCVGFLAVQLSFTGGTTVTYSESALGALVSPWNPTVVILPMVLFGVLCAAAPAGSPLSLLGAVLVGSFIIQTDISAAIMVVVFLAASVMACAITAARARQRSRRPVRAQPADDAVAAGAGGAAEGGTTPPYWAATGLWGRVWAGLGAVALVAMWVPPLIQQFTTNPGNMTLIIRFFTGPQSTASATLADSFRAAMAEFGVLTIGPSEVMNLALGRVYPHPAVASVTAAVLVAIAVAVVLVGLRRHHRFAVMLGALSLAGTAVTVFDAFRVTGPVWGYLLVWAVAAPLLGLIGLGVLVLAPADRPVAATRTRAVLLRTGVCGVAVVVCVVLSVRATALPPLSTVSDPAVGATVALVTPKVTPGRPFELVDTLGADLLGTERFVGVVNLLDARGYDPKVGGFWTDLVGPGFLSTGHESTQVFMGRWTAHSPSSPGYVGRVDDYAITVTTR
ncbi:MAG TPA: hypothetical protein VNV87_06040 [Acidimicrobiales bacterium]|nr:hypothetical protein [Acidimicrobiales bacterium]